MAGEIVMALYRPHEGKTAELRALIAGHLPALKAEGLVTDRPALLLQAADGTFIEIFEWRSAEAASRAHGAPRIAAIWEAVGKIADFVPLNALPEAAKLFSHFRPVDL